MLREERFDHILSLLKQQGKVAYDLVSDDLKVSEDTIRRDIDTLHTNGLLTKVRGGAILPSRNPLTFQDRKDYLSEGKEIIALKTLQQLKKDQTIFMDGGTTICAIAARLPLHSSFRIITNNIALVPILSKHKGIEIIVLGGTYQRNTETNTGFKTCEQARLYVADLYLMGTCAFHDQFGVTASEKEDGDVKQAMLHSALSTVALCNVEKLDTTFAFKVCEVKDINVLVTDRPSNDPKLDLYRNQGVRLL